MSKAVRKLGKIIEMPKPKPQFEPRTRQAYRARRRRRRRRGKQGRGGVKVLAGRSRERGIPAKQRIEAMSKEPAVIRAVVEFVVHPDEGMTAAEIASELVHNDVEVTSGDDEFGMQGTIMTAEVCGEAA